MCSPNNVACYMIFPGCVHMITNGERLGHLNMGKERKDNIEDGMGPAMLMAGDEGITPWGGDEDGGEGGNDVSDPWGWWG